MPSSSVIFCAALWVSKQYQGLPLAGPALAADRAPIEDHVVADRHVGDALADRGDQPGRLVTEQEREVVVDPALAVVQVGVADPARLHVDHGLAGTGSGTTIVSIHRRALPRATTPFTSYGMRRA